MPNTPHSFAQRVPFQVNVLQVEIRRIQIAGRGSDRVVRVVGRVCISSIALFSAEINVPRLLNQLFQAVAAGLL